MAKRSVAGYKEEVMRFMEGNLPACIERSRGGELDHSPLSACGDQITVSTRLGVWGVDCSVIVHLDDKRVDLTWSSTHRTITESVAALAVYRQCVEFGAMVEAFMLHWRA